MTETTAVKTTDPVKNIRNYFADRHGGKLGAARAKQTNEIINQVNKN